MMNQNNTAIIKQGQVGEEYLLDWFQENSIGFFHLCQSKDTFANTFSGRLKRPDFLLLFESIGMLAVDAKNCSLSSTGCFTISTSEIRRAIGFELCARMPFWFVFLQQEESGNVWYWLNAIKALDLGATRVNQRTGGSFQAIALKEFTPVRTYTDLSLIFKQSLGILSGKWTKTVACLPSQ